MKDLVCDCGSSISLILNNNYDRPACHRCHEKTRKALELKKELELELDLEKKKKLQLKLQLELELESKHEEQVQNKKYIREQNKRRYGGPRCIQCKKMKSHHMIHNGKCNVCRSYDRYPQDIFEPRGYREIINSNPLYGLTPDQNSPCRLYSLAASRTSIGAEMCAYSKKWTA
jgi:hypothetical protein